MPPANPQLLHRAPKSLSNFHVNQGFHPLTASHAQSSLGSPTPKTKALGVPSLDLPQLLLLGLKTVL